MAIFAKKCQLEITSSIRRGITHAHKALQAYFAFVKACFSVLISTAIVEACFSGFTSMKDRHRSVLGDGRVLDALVSRQAVDVFANGAVSFRELELRQDAHTHRLPW